MQSPQGEKMKKLFVAFLFIAGAFLPFSATATTYDYQGASLNQIDCQFCNPFGYPGLTGSVTFDFDTSSFTGEITLSPGDTAVLSGALGGGRYPNYFPPAGVIGNAYLLSGYFDLVNGQISGWYLNGGEGLVNCGIGAGCEQGIGVTTSPYLDSYSQTYEGYTTMYESSSPGVWTEVAAVPELSTWAMLLIGFAGIGFASWQRTRLTRGLACVGNLG
jgi:hypothetical protein